MLQHTASRFVIVGERGYNLNMTPIYARAPRGERAHAALPRNVPATTTRIAARTNTCMTAPMVVSGATDHHVVEAYVEHVLGPTLRPGQVVVLDNLSAHKRANLEPLLARYGCQVWFLPPYSPDLSPIELAFAKLKHSDAQALFAHCGFLTDPPSAQPI
jgi:transposase